MPKLTILDYNSGEVHVYNVKKSQDYEKYISKKTDHQLRNCYYMVTDALTIIQH